MKITKENAEIINTPKVYMHDDLFVDMHFDYKNQLLSLSLKRYPTRYSKWQDYNIYFEQVYGYVMTSSHFWGQGDFVLDFLCLSAKDQVLLPRLRAKVSEASADDSLKIISELERCMEVKIVLNSGDELTVVCETVNIKLDSLHLPTDV